MLNHWNKDTQRPTELPFAMADSHRGNTVPDSNTPLSLVQIDKLLKSMGQQQREVEQEQPHYQLLGGSSKSTSVGVSKVPAPENSWTGSCASKTIVVSSGAGGAQTARGVGTLGLPSVGTAIPLGHRGIKAPATKASLIAELHSLSKNKNGYHNTVGKGTATVSPGTGWGVGGSNGAPHSARCAPPVLSAEGSQLLAAIPAQASTVSLPPTKPTTINRVPKVKRGDSQFSGPPKTHAIMNLKVVAAQKAQKRIEESKRLAKVQQDVQDRILHRRIMKVFADRTDNTLQARNQLRNIQGLLKEASVIGRQEGDGGDTSSSDFEDEDEDEEDVDEYEEAFLSSATEAAMQGPEGMEVLLTGDEEVDTQQAQILKSNQEALKRKGKSDIDVGSSALSRKMCRKEKRRENEQFVDLLTGTKKKHGGGIERLAPIPGSPGATFSDEENGNEEVVNRRRRGDDPPEPIVPKKKLRIIYEGDDVAQDEAQEELDADPNIYTDPKRVYERQRQIRALHGDDVDPQKLKGRYEGAAIGAAPSFSSASLSRIMETAVTDAVEQRLATEGILRIITDPQQQHWKVGSLEGEIARLMFHVTRLMVWCKAAREQIPMYYSGAEIIKQGSSEELVQYRTSVIASKEAVEMLERHTERQQLENHAIRRAIGALKEEYLVKQFAMQVDSAVPDLDSVNHADAFLKMVRMPQQSGGDDDGYEEGEEEEKEEEEEDGGTTVVFGTPSGRSTTTTGSPTNESLLMPRQPSSKNSRATTPSWSDEVTKQEGGMTSISSSSSPAIAALLAIPAGSASSPLSLDPPPAAPLTAKEKEAKLVWDWSLMRLRQLLGKRRTRLQAAVRLKDDKQVTRLIDQRDISDGRSDTAIQAEIGVVDVLIRELAPRKAPSHTKVRHLSTTLSVTDDSAQLLRSTRTDGTAASTSVGGSPITKSVGGSPSAPPLLQGPSMSELNLMAQKLKKIKENQQDGGVRAS